MSITATVTANTLNLRRSPGAAAEKIGQLNRGARLELLTRTGTWYEIQAGSQHGYVHGDYIHLDAGAAGAGFLCDDEALCKASLEPAEAARIRNTRLVGDRRMAADTWNRLGGMLASLCAAIDLALAAAIAVLCVESSGRGFAKHRMVIRFENHIFWDQWGKHDPETFRRHFSFDTAKRWTRHQYRDRAGHPWLPLHSNNTGQDAEWRAFELARTLNEPAALRSISMGAAQIMGFNHARIGYDSAREMFDRFNSDERFHVLGLFDFIRGAASTSAMLEALRRGQYEQFATSYNGNGQAAIYGSRIRTMVDAFEQIKPVTAEPALA